MSPSDHNASPPLKTSRYATAWSYAVVWLAVVSAYGAVWTRGVQGDDLCMCELATAHGYWDAVRAWLDNWNGRLFLALTQIGTYHLPWFSDPLDAPWYLIHAMAVLAHMAACGLLLGLLSRAGIAAGASLAAILIYAIHPIGFEPVLWLAESYGYVLGNLLSLLAVWSYLEYERSSRIGWLLVALLLALTAALGIEQYLVVLCALSIVYWSRSHWRRPAHPAWLPLLIMTCCSMVFLALHFGGFSGTADRLARATAETAVVAGPTIVWKMAWWMSLLPDASPYGGLLHWGWNTIRGHAGLTALVGLATILAAWRVLATSSWQDKDVMSSPHRHLWLVAIGMAVVLASVSPFLVTGRYGFASRNMFVALPGIVTMVATALDLMASRAARRRMLRFAITPVVAAFMATSLVIDSGAQALFARSWRFHRNVIETIKADAESVRAAGALLMTGIPARPYKAIAQIDSDWAFPCLVRWVVGASEVRAWNNLMSSKAGQHVPPDSHHIVFRED